MAVELSKNAIARRLAELESEIRRLRVQLERPVHARAGMKTFSDLCGIWRGQHDFTYEEIEQAEYRIPEDSL
jgi:hypothetical protein